MQRKSISFFTVALFNNGTCQTNKFHLMRIKESLEKFGYQKDFPHVVDLWNSHLMKLSSLPGYKRVKIVFSRLNDKWQLNWNISDFVPEIKAPLNIGVYELQSPRWESAPGMIKTGEGHDQLASIFDKYLALGYDEIIFLGRNREWGDSYYSNVGVLIDNKLFFSRSSHYVQDGVGVMRLIESPLISPWPVEFVKLSWDKVFSMKDSIFILINEVRGPRIVGKIADRICNIGQEHMDKTAKFHQRWYQ